MEECSACFRLHRRRAPRQAKLHGCCVAGEDHWFGSVRAEGRCGTRAQSWRHRNYLWRDEAADGIDPPRWSVTEPDYGVILGDADRGFRDEVRAFVASALTADVR